MTNYIRFKQLQQQYIPVTRATLWRWVRAGEFPPPIVLTPNRVGSSVIWPEDEIIEWLATRPRGFGQAWPRLSPARSATARSRREAIAAENIRNGRTPRFGFRRGDDVPLTNGADVASTGNGLVKPNRFTRGN